MYQQFNIEEWNRKHIYHLFSTYDDPFFNICSNVEVTALNTFCKSRNYSFSLALLYFSMEAANELPEFRLRTIDNKLVLFDSIHCGCTIFHEDATFSFCYFNRKGTLQDFLKNSRNLIDEQHKKRTFDPKTTDVDLIHHSVIPWTSFTSIKHAKKLNTGDTIPKIAFGRYFENENKLMLPISVEVNHALMDGYHVGQYLTILQHKMNALA
jgi:chloramphenicol O-acetyltransferase type A